MHPDFPALSPDIIYLNHAAVAPWPARTAEAVRRFADENATLGSARYPQWLEVEQRLRGRLADLIGASSPADIALAKSTSEGLSVLAYGLQWHAGDRVVGIAQEFPSNRVVWESLAALGVEYRALDLATTDDPEAALLALCDERTRVLAVSSVQYARGLRLDLARLGGACRERGILLCVDAIQSLGAVPFDLARTGAHCVVADGHKWMLGPEGIALLYIDPWLRERLRLNQFGWHMLEHAGDFDKKSWTIAADARRFEAGSPNMLGIQALEASLSLLQEHGIAAVAAAIEQRVDRLIELIDHRGFELLTPRERERRAGIVTFRVPDADHQALYTALMRRGVMCAARGGGIRFSPHFYTDEEALGRAIAICCELAAG